MLPSGLKETQVHENPKVYPQPMEGRISLNKSDIESLISKVFMNISSLKAAYIQFQTAHTPYDPSKIQAADKLVIEQLGKLSEVKHAYRESNPKTATASFANARMVAEIQEQQNLLKTYEVMVKKFQLQIQSKDSELLELHQQIQDVDHQRGKLEKKLRQRGLLMKASEDFAEQSGFFSMELTPNLFSAAVDGAYKAVYEFSKPLINLMKASGWDLDEAANAIQPDVMFAKRAHKKFIFQSYICLRMFSDFDSESFCLRHEDNAVAKDGFFHQFLALRAEDPLDVLSQKPDSEFGIFCKKKYLSLIHADMESSFFGNLDQRNFISEGGHPRTPFYQAFLKLAKSIWLLHRLALSFNQKVVIFQVRSGNKFSKVYMERVVKGIATDNGEETLRVGFMVMPGFRIEGEVIPCLVYLTDMDTV